MSWVICAHVSAFGRVVGTPLCGQLCPLRERGVVCLFELSKICTADEIYMKCSEYHFLARLFLGVKFVSIRCAGFSTTSFGSVRKRVSMICRNGAQLTARSIDGRSVAAKGFFSLFYQWSQTGCLAGRNGKIDL